METVKICPFILLAEQTIRQMEKQITAQPDVPLCEPLVYLCPGCKKLRFAILSMAVESEKLSSNFLADPCPGETRH